MGRKRGMPAYGRKTKQGSFITTYEAWVKLKGAARRTGKSESDVITHCLLVAADDITRDTLEKKAQARREEATSAA